MNRSIIALGAVAVLSLTSCGTSTGTASGGEATATFPAPAGDLTIRNEFGRVRVVEADTREVRVVRTVTTIGRRASAPGWAMEGSTLVLASACGKGFVGVCEPTFQVTVPRGTKVTVRQS